MPGCIEKGDSQNARIFRVLEANKGQWVSMPELARAGAGNPQGFCMVHSRIADLRKANYLIENRAIPVKGKVQSFYRLIDERLT